MIVFASYDQHMTKIKFLKPQNFLPFVLVFFSLSCQTETSGRVNSISNSTNQVNLTLPAAKPAASAKYEDKRTPMHHRLDPLIGEWDVEKTNKIIPGFSPEKPLVSKGTITTHREWMTGTGDFFIKDETIGKFGEFDYYRLGVLGYSIPDDRYEWNTTDNFNPMMMTYKGEPGSGKASGDISISGEYTDAGMLGEQFKGKTIKQRTEIKIESNDRHTVNLYFTPPGEPEKLVDTMVYTRRKQ